MVMKQRIEFYRLLKIEAMLSTRLGFSHLSFTKRCQQAKRDTKQGCWRQVANAGQYLAAVERLRVIAKKHKLTLRGYVAKGLFIDYQEGR